MMLEVLVAIISPILLYIIYDFLKQILLMRSYPPGPIPYPLFGNLRLFRNSAHRNFHKVKQKYGDVSSFTLPPRRVVLINHIDIAREVLIQQGDKTAGRWVFNYIGYILGKDKDLVASEGERWKRLRKMVHSSLQMYGYGMDRLESLIVTESENLHKKLASLNGEPVDPRLILALFLTNITCALMFGKRYDDDDPEFDEIMQFQDCMKRAINAKEIVSVLPFLRIFPIFKSIDLANQAVEIRNRIFIRKIQEHKDSYDADNIRDFTDSLLKFSDIENETANTFLLEDIIFLLHDFVFAGVDTGLNSIGFGLLYLVHHPEYQDVIIEEFDDVLGDRKYPSLQDRPRLPFLHATVMEVLRHSSVAFLGLIHRCTEPTKIGKYTVQKDTCFFYNVWSMNHDERYWENPDEFNPKRWLNEDGSVKLGGKESFISFGLGRRNCVGETLAKAELFLCLGRLLRDFQLLPADDEHLPSLEADLSFLLCPKPSKIRFVPRFTSN